MDACREELVVFNLGSEREEGGVAQEEFVEISLLSFKVDFF